jgi:polyhydroxyalkanoate synthesis regulator protein
MQAFAKNQERMRDYLRSAFDGLMPFASFEEMSKQQIAIFEQAMRMLTPFYIEEPTKREKPIEPQTSAAEAQIQELRSHLNQIQKQLDELVSGRDK